VERGIDRALGQIEGAAAALAQPFEDRVAVRRLLRHDGEEERVEMSLERLGSHYLAMLGIGPAAVKSLDG